MDRYEATGRRQGGDRQTTGDRQATGRRQAGDRQATPTTEKSPWHSVVRDYSDSEASFHNTVSAGLRIISLETVVMEKVPRGVSWEWKGGGRGVDGGGGGGGGGGGEGGGG